MKQKGTVQNHNKLNFANKQITYKFCHIFEHRFLKHRFNPLTIIIITIIIHTNYRLDCITLWEKAKCWFISRMPEKSLDLIWTSIYLFTRYLSDNCFVYGNKMQYPRARIITTIKWLILSGRKAGTPFGNPCCCILLSPCRLLQWIFCEAAPQTKGFEVALTFRLRTAGFSKLLKV